MVRTGSDVSGRSPAQYGDTPGGDACGSLLEMHREVSQATTIEAS